MNDRSLRVLGMFVVVVAVCWLPLRSFADQRTLTSDQLKALQQNGDFVFKDKHGRVTHLPDLTKGEKIKAKIERSKYLWHLGPTGIYGYLVGGYRGCQIQVEHVVAGTPADGNLRWGDVILAVNGQPFKVGGNMAIQFGNAIIASERKENSGLLKLLVWRDKNFIKRHGSEDIRNMDIEKFFNQARSDSLYDWKKPKQRAKSVDNTKLKKYPIDGHTMEITLKLRVMPPYSDTSPYNCPKADKIREDALKVIAKSFMPDKHGHPGKGGSLKAIALVASGEPKYLKLVHDWARSKKGKVWQADPNKKITLDHPRGYLSWKMGFDGLNCAIYYDATHDKFVLPALRRYAIMTAMGQAGGGSWGHTFAWPQFNGGKLHGMNPGYGALNAAGNRCFFLIALAKKLGIKSPQLDLAVKRAKQFFGSYVDKGAIPYGYHPAANTDDSNGKNSGVAFALKLLGDDYGAKYFAKMSSHASFTRRGGHGHDWFGNWSGWAATLCGPKVTIATERNLRWRRTLNRCYDGSFVYQSPTGGYRTLRDPTATMVLFYSAPLKQTIITGKDPDKSLWLSDKEFSRLMEISRSQLNNPKLLAEAGKPWQDRSTDDVFKLINIFMPQAREAVAKELAKRYKAGEKDIVPRLAKLLDSTDERARDGACRALRACGADATLQYLSKVVPLLEDPKEFVRIQATKTVTLASNNQNTKLALLHAAAKHFDDTGQPPNNLRSAIASPLFAGKDGLGKDPFKSGFNDQLVRSVLDKIITLDPGPSGLLRWGASQWDKSTAIRIAGPLVFISEDKQVNDQMFASRRSEGLALLNRLGYREGLEASADLLRKHALLPHDVRPYVWYKDPMVDPSVIKKYPGSFTYLLKPMKQWLLDDPTAEVKDPQDKTQITTVQQMVNLIESAKVTPERPSIASEAEAAFQAELAKAGNDADKEQKCRAVLQKTGEHDTFRQIAAMDYLAKDQGMGALPEILPYVGHSYWRLRDHAQALLGKLVKKHGAEKVIAVFGKTNDQTAVGLLNVFADYDVTSAYEVAKLAMSNASPQVREAAIVAVAKLGKEKALPDIFAFIADNKAKTEEDRRGCEKALLVWREDPAYTQQVRAKALSMLPSAAPALQASLCWVLGQIGGSDAIKAVDKITHGDDEQLYRKAVIALSYSPDLDADDALLSIIKANSKSNRANFAATQSVRRMVQGPKGIGTRTTKQQLDFAQPLLKMVLNQTMIEYLKNIHTGRCAQILQNALRHGATSIDTARSIVTVTKNLKSPSAKDREQAVSALLDLIQYVEVQHLRGGVKAHLHSYDSRAAQHYMEWKAVSAQAGKNLLKLKKPEKAPLPQFNDMQTDF